MSAYDATYVQECWPLLYQCIDRFLREHLLRMLRREDEKLDAAIEKGGSIDFKPSKPWAHLMYLATTEEAEGSAEHRWWATNIIEKTTLVVAKVAL